MSLVCGLMAVATLGSAPLTIQIGMTDITPDEPLPLGGYSARLSKKSEPGGDPLFARTLIFKQDRTTLAVVSCEMLTIPESLVRDVRARIPSNVRLFLTATHTHCAPDSQMLNDRMTFSLPGIAKFEPKWLTWYAERISGGINAALKAKPDSSSIQYRKLRLASNRGRRRLADPMQEAYLVQTESKNLFSWYSAHPVFFGSERLQTSGDWAGNIAAKLDAFQLVGAIGDVSPAAEGATAEDRVKAFVERYLPIASAPVHGVGKGTFRVAQVGIELPQALYSLGFATQNRIPESLAKSIVERFAPKEASITAFRIGKLAVIGVPGEPTSALGRRIRDEGRRLGFDAVLVTSHVNGWIGYILEPDDFARGGYEASLDFYGEPAAQRVYEAAQAAMKSLTHSP